MILPYSFYSGAGNLFILIDNRDLKIEELSPSLIYSLCTHPRELIADGVILLGPSTVADFSMRIFNRDGSEADMCGNGLRTLIRFLDDLGEKRATYAVETKAYPTMGLFFGALAGNEVKIQLAKPHSFQWDLSLTLDGKKWPLHFLNTGVPHAVLFVPEIENIDVVNLGRTIRHNEAFKPHGTNVTFATPTLSNSLSIRTFERGVEDETGACGTGAVAAALAAYKIKGISSPVDIFLKSKEKMQVSFVEKEGQFDQVTLQGSAKKIASGSFTIP